MNNSKGQQKKLSIIPLGGLGEIGKNMTAFVYGNDMILVDAGLAFPDDDMLGIDLVIPDTTFLMENKEKFKAIFLTHGHEDHIGALPYVMKDFDVPVYGTPLTLGIPGESVTAVLMGGLIIHGLQPGPELFTKYAPMTYTFFGGFVVIQFFMLIIGLIGCRLFAKIARVSDAILIPSIFVLCVVGSFAINNSAFDVKVMFVFGIIGYLMRKCNMNTAAVVLALILGPLGEKGLRRSLSLSGGDTSILLSTNICKILLALCLLSLLSPFVMKFFKKEKKADEAVLAEEDKEIDEASKKNEMK